MSDCDNMQNSAGERILVIKLSALGDFVLAFGAFAAIRAGHPHSHITVLTTGPYVALAEQAPWFDAVWVDHRPKAWQPCAVLRLRRKLRDGRFSRVYDLQTSDRSSRYFRLMGGASAVEWSGIARGCSHPHANPQRNKMHTLDRHSEQLSMAGISAVDWPDMSWLKGRGAEELDVALTGAVALLVPGGAPHRPEKRWPASCYAHVAVALVAAGLTPVVIGTHSEQEASDSILAACPQARSLLGKTNFADIAALGRRAALAVGNDTGPMHLIAISGCPSIILYSRASDPALCAPRGPTVDILRVETLQKAPAPTLVVQRSLAVRRT